MRKTKEQKAITLIALIITIVVLLILAVVAINAVTGDGIIQHAVNAKEDYEKAQDEENKTLSYYQTYLDTKGQIGKWVQNDNKISMINSDGKLQELEIGAYVKYNPTAGLSETEISNLIYTSYSLENASSDKNNGRTSGYTSNQEFNVADYSGTWQVLGVENGQLLLISSDYIANSVYLYGKKGYQYAVDELDAICSIYGYGKNENGKNIIDEARALKIEDVNKITGYNPKNVVYPDDYLEAYKYGCKIRYTKIDGGLKYELLNTGEEGVSTNYTEYTYFNGAEWVTLQVGESSSIMENTHYVYYTDTLTEYYDDDLIGLSSDSKIYKMLFEPESNASVSLLSSPVVSIGTAQSAYGISGFFKEDNESGTRSKISYGWLANSSNEEKSVNGGIRAVVKLVADAVLTEQSDVTLGVN